MSDKQTTPPLISEMSVIITGATRGIGAGIATELGSRGAKLTLGYLEKDEQANALKQELESKGVEVILYKGDLSSKNAARGIVEVASSAYDRVDALVGNLGPFLWRSIAEMSDDDWDRMLSVNLTAQFRLVKELLPGMRDRGSGNFVFIGGIGSGQVSGYPRASAYNAAKVGLAVFMKSLAVEEGPGGIRANMIAPGIIDNGEYSDEFKRKIVSEIPLGLVGQPADIAHAVAWLLSPESKYVTGTVIDVSGGYHLTV